VKDLVEHYTTLDQGRQSEQVVRIAYDNFLREPLRTYARDEVQKLNGLEMATISERLTGQYLQHEAIEAQKAMVGSPNHTTIYLPIGPTGVPLVGTLEHAK